MENPKVKRLKTVQLEDHVRCCLDSHTLQDPYLLMCCHVYCKSCLPQLQVKDGYICQVCQLTTSTERLLPSDFLSQMIKKCERIKLKPECSHCDTNTPPGYKCTECQMFVCSDRCKTRHLQFPGHHTFLPYSKETDQLVINPVLLCPEHRDKRLEINCKTCHKIICEHCTVENHESHEFGVLKTGIDESLKEITPLRKTLTNMDVLCKATKASTEEKMATLNYSVDKELEEFRVFKDKLVAQIEEQYLEVKRVIAYKQEELNKYYKQVINEETNKLTCVRSALEWSRLVEVHAESECLLKTLQTELIPQLKALCESLNQEQSPVKIRKPEDVKLNIATFRKPSTDEFCYTFYDSCRIEECTGTELWCTDKNVHTTNLIDNSWKTVNLNHVSNHNQNTDIAEEWEFKMPEGADCFSLCVVNDRILAPLNGENVILVLSFSGELILSKNLHKNVLCRGIQKLTDTELILSTTEGLYLLDSTSLDIIDRIYDKGDFPSGFTVSNGAIVALDFESKKLIILTCLGGRKLLQRTIQLQGQRGEIGGNY